MLENEFNVLAEALKRTGWLLHHAEAYNRIKKYVEESSKTPTNTARDAICPHWETYNRGGSGEFGACNCGGKISSGQTAPVA